MADYKTLDDEQLHFLAYALFTKLKSWYAMEWAVTLPVSGWSSSAPYTQTVTVDGIKESDNPMMFLNKSDSSYTDATEDAQTTIETEYLYIKQVETADGSITATCTFNKPTADIRIILKGH